MISAGIAGLHGALRLLRRRHPRVDLLGLQAGVDGVVVGELDRVQVQRVDDVGLLRCPARRRCADRRRLAESGDRRPRRHDQREVAEVVAVGEPDGAPASVGGGDRRRADVEAPRRHLREQAGELGADEIDSQTQLFGDRAQQLVVEAGELALRVDADARRCVGQGADGQHTWCARAERVDVDGVERLHGRRRVLVLAGSLGGGREVRRNSTGAVDAGRCALVDVGGGEAAIGRLRTSSPTSARTNDLRRLPARSFQPT